MILTFQTSFPTVDEEERFADINVPETRTVDDLFKVVSAETGVSLTSPMEIVINDVKFYRNDTRTLVAAGINEYDMVEVKVLKNGSRPIPGNVTITDLYNALGDRLKKMKIDSFSQMVIESTHEEPKKEEAEPPKVEAPKVEAPKVAAPVKAPAATNAFAVKAPAATNAFAVKAPAAPVKAPAATNAFAVKPKATAFAIKTPAKVAAPAPTAPSVPAPVEEKPAPVEEKPAVPEEVKPAVTAPAAPPAPVAKPQFAVKTNAFAVKNKFAIKKP